MLVHLDHKGQSYQVNLAAPIDLSVSLGRVRCFHAPPVSLEAFRAGDFVGSVQAGAAVNFFNVEFNPHGNGTHTECMGHITREHQSLNQHLGQFHHVAKLISIRPNSMANGDQIILLAQLQDHLSLPGPEALVIRSLPNDLSKMQRDYSGSNPPFVDHKAVQFLVESGIKHLVLDLPSIDKERDGGELKGHKAFWAYPGTDRLDCSITELAYIPDEAEDGLYLLNLQTIPLELDASPSRPVLYRMLHT